MTASGWRKRQIANKMEDDMSGKGSSPRPFSVSQEEYDKRWDAIFNRDLPREPEPIIEGELPVTEEEEEAWEEIDDSCPKCRHGAMMLTGTGFHWFCDVCGYREKVEPEEP